MTKPSSSTKHHSGKKVSKINMLRRKLTLRIPNSPIITNEGEPTHNEEIAVNARKDTCFQRASPMKLVRLYPSMTGRQKDLIKLWGYGGLVNIKCSKLDPGLCKFVMESFDPTTLKLVFPGRGAIDVTEESVEEVIGVPRGDIDVRYEMDAAAISFMTEQLGKKSTRQPTIASLEKKLAEMKEADNNYLRLFITYGMCSVLAPTTGVHISPRLYPSLVNIENANRLNMCKFVVMMLRKAKRSRSKKAILKSCMLYLMVKYLDSLKLEGVDVRSEGTRVSVWTNSMVKKAISQDQREDGTFGLAPLKDEFATTETPSEATDQGASNSAPLEEEEQCEEPLQEEAVEESILFADAGSFDLFVQMNAPPDCTAEEKERYKEAVKKACKSFESSLQILVRELPIRSAKATNRKRNKKRTSARKRKRQRIHEVIPIASQCAENHKSEDDSDDDFQQGDELEENTQATVSLDDESVELSLVSTQQESQDERYLRRKKRESLRSHVKGTEENVDSNRGSGQHDQSQEEEHMGGTTSFVEASQGKPEEEVSTEQEDADLSQSVPAGETTAEAKAGDTMDFTEEEDAPTVEGHQDQPRNEVTSQDHSMPAAETACGHPPTSHQDIGRDSIDTKTQNKQATVPASDNHHQQVTTNQDEEPPREPPAEMRDFQNYLEALKTKFENKVEAISKKKIVSEINTSKGQREECKMQGGASGDALRILGQTYQSTTESSGAVATNEDLQGEDSANNLECIIDRPLFETPVIIDLELNRQPHIIMEHLTLRETSGAADSGGSLDLGTPRHELEELLKEIEPQQPETTKRKEVTFAALPQMEKKLPANASPSPNRYRTRAAAREELKSTPSKAAEDLGARRVTRSMPTRLSSEGSAQNTLTTDVPSSAAHDPMNRKLNFDSTESERELRAKQRAACAAAPDAPVFDVDTPPEDNEEQEPGLRETVANTMKENIPPSGGQAGCSNATAGPSTASVTPVPHELDKRAIKRGKYAQSPFINPEIQKNYTVSKSVEELYNMVCQHGEKSGSTDNDKPVFDVGTLYVSLGHLADSVKPGKQLINTVAEMAIHVMIAKNPNPKKAIMPLRIAKYLIDARFNLKDVTKVFENSPANRLDHKEVICFPTLEKFTLNPKGLSGHYWLVVLNVKAERFEIMDSLAVHGNALMTDACRSLIAGIKTMWDREYKNSKVKIADWPIELIESPKQTNTFDCGFFTLKNLEEKHGRMPSSFTQKDIPKIRMLYTDKWLRFAQNKAPWKLII